MGFGIVQVGSRICLAGVRYEGASVLREWIISEVIVLGCIFAEFFVVLPWSDIDGCSCTHYIVPIAHEQDIKQDYVPLFHRPTSRAPKRSSAASGGLLSLTNLSNSRTFCLR
jgi:hypothetical protein